MADITIHPHNEVFIRIDAESGIAHELSDFFTFTVPGHKFMPSYKARAWDGKIRLFNAFNGEVYAGLQNYVLDYADRMGYTVECKTRENKIAPEEVGEFLLGLNPHSQGKVITPYDYQMEAVYHAINKERALLLSPTSSGKSFMIYSLVNWYMQRVDKKILVIVPTTSLVEQLEKDFKDYSTSPDSNIEFAYNENMTHKIYSGKDKMTDRKIVITTWQSIYKLKSDWFQQFDVVIGDEAHNFKAKSLTSILTKMVNCKYRFGFTGTLDGTQTNRLVLEGLFGPVKKVITTKELMDDETITKLHIEAVVLGYTDAEKKAMKDMVYQEEIDWLITNPKRNKFIKELTISRKKNTLVLFQYVDKHGKKLYDELKTYLEKSDPERPIFFVSGEIKTEEREAIRQITETSDNAIIVASYGTFSTGINIRNLHNVIFAHPSKSRIRNLQSVGRVLRKADGKTKATLFDIGDDLSWKKHKNYSLKHFLERVKTYNSEKFDYEIRSIKL